MSAFWVEPNSDPALAESIERAIGWPRTLPEIARRFEVAQGFVARSPEGEAIGTTTVACYEPGLAWVGGMGVLPAWRGRGVARALLEAALAEARGRGATTIGLDATEAGRPLYERAGFQAVGRSSRWRRATGAPVARTSARHSVHPISLSEAMEIAAFDEPRFGAKRLRWLLGTMHHSPWTAFMSRHRASGDVSGFILGQERMVGPLVADDDEAAVALLAACELAGAPPVLLVMDDHAAVRRLLHEAGYSPDGAACTRMTVGGPLPGRPATQYGLGAWALG